MTGMPILAAPGGTFPLAGRPVPRLGYGMGQVTRNAAAGAGHAHLGSRGALVAAARAGVTTLVDLGTHPDSLIAEQRAESGVASIVSAGSAASAPGSTQIALMGFPAASGVAGPADAERFLDWRVEHGSELVKIIVEDPDLTDVPRPRRADDRRPRRRRAPARATHRRARRHRGPRSTARSTPASTSSPTRRSTDRSRTPPSGGWSISAPSPPPP